MRTPEHHNKTVKKQQRDQLRELFLLFLQCGLTCSCYMVVCIYLQQHNVIISLIFRDEFRMWDELSHVNPLLARLFFGDVVSSEYRCHASADK